MAPAKQISDLVFSIAAAEDAKDAAEDPWVPASQIRVGDRIVRRNSCGGLVDTLRVVGASDGRCLLLERGWCYFINGPDALVEVAS